MASCTMPSCHINAANTVRKHSAAAGDRASFTAPQEASRSRIYKIDRQFPQLFYFYQPLLFFSLHHINIALLEGMFWFWFL